MRLLSLALRAWGAIFLAILLPASLPSQAADEFDRPPIEYSRTRPENALSRLRAAVDEGSVKLEYEQGLGYLQSLLRALDVPLDSQTLVFSKTSLQTDRISPRTPRAIYFNDDLYLGFCQGGEVIEISAVDPRLGAVFYTLSQRAEGPPQFIRHTDTCLSCHSSSRSEGVPGHVVRSMFVQPSGRPLYAAGSVSVDHTTPFEQRWGGWYVTGEHGSQPHRGNLLIDTPAVPEPLDNTAGQNVTDLSNYFLVSRYPAPHSDLVALMVLEHQTFTQNRITKAGFTAREALHYQRELNRALGDPDDQPLESTTRRIANAAEGLIEALLFCNEAELREPLRGTSGFQETFPKRGPRDSQGRSLRDFHLEGRLFRHPCSYLIYSEQFLALPEPLLEVVWGRLWDILAQGADADKFTHLSAEDRRAILEILVATHPALPAGWEIPTR